MDTINGLPAHPLFVHLAVVAIPLAALLALVAAVWPAARTRLSVLPLIVATVAMIITPLTTSAGESLRKHTESSPELTRHADLGGQMIGWVATLFVLTVLLWALHQDWLLARLPARPSAGATRIITIALAVATVVVAVGTVVMVILVGDAGARATWAN
ncbi:DUF2231 domain-containing protein [Gordonia sp. DT30]|uniref:DUF2231 domain-containing protein n=1 Tax=unclassified Gordonia (in: high G+C Gram-positive bacteria) TaxID=2657482 RepID=UPI003CF800EF